MSSGITDSSLLYHLENAKAHGVTKAEAAAIITHAPFFALKRMNMRGNIQTGTTLFRTKEAKDQKTSIVEKSKLLDFSTMPATTESTLFYLSFYKFLNFH